ncbi:MAG: hypothetical protein QW165_01770 [Candidatus Woesearchaeota archaeon]
MSKRDEKTVKDYVKHGVKIKEKVHKDLCKATPEGANDALDKLNYHQALARKAVPALAAILDEMYTSRKEAASQEKRADRLQNRVTTLAGQIGNLRKQNATYIDKNKRLTEGKRRLATENRTLRTDVDRLTEENNVFRTQIVPQYDAELSHLRTQQTSLQGQLTGLNSQINSLTGLLGTATSERDEARKESKRNRTWAYASTIATGILALATGIFSTAYFMKGNSNEKAPASIGHSVNDISLKIEEHDDLYNIVMRADGQFLKVLGTDYEFKIPEGAKDAIVTYIAKASKHAAKKGKLGTRVHFEPKELEATLKELYSQGEKSTYGDEDKLVKQDIERAIKEMGD